MKLSELNEIFEKIILPEAEGLLNQYSGLYLIENAFEVFSSEYSILHEYYLKKYMNPNSQGLDTHKEISTIVIALLKVKILKTLNEDYYKADNSKYAFNERLAFKVSCGILTTIISCDYEDDETLSPEEKTFSIKEFDNKGLLFPPTTYQEYVQNTITEFYYTSREGNYNFLGLADKIFWIEYFNKELIKGKYMDANANKHS